ncbi:hypothetical protein SUDANB25_02467 [Streptomyces sp. SudanB25_2051]
MSSACTQHSKARSISASRSGSENGPYGTDRSVAPCPANDTVRTSVCAWSRHGSRMHPTPPSSANARQNASVRSTGPAAVRTRS